MWQGDHKEDIQKAGQALRDGGLVAFPTETVYGLGADGLNPDACRAIFTAKGRPQDNPLILHIADLDGLKPLVRDLPVQALSLGQAFWPGPLTMVFNKSSQVSDVVSAGLDTVAIRMPDHPVALALIRETGRPLAAPSANLSGRPSPTQASHVVHDFSDSLAGIIDGGPCQIGLESTIVDMTTHPPCLLRPGGLSREAIEDVIGPIQTSLPLSPQDAPKAPGMKYRHYAPKAPLTLLDSDDPVAQVLACWQGDAHGLGFLLSSDSIAQLPSPPSGVHLIDLGPRHRPDRAGQALYASLRKMDELAVRAIYAETWEASGLGATLMNRLLKAASSFQKEDRQ